MRYDAVAFLKSLFDPAIDAMLEAKPEDLSGEWREVYEERAGIREFDGGLPRELAEHYALLDVLKMKSSGWTEQP